MKTCPLEYENPVLREHGFEFVKMCAPCGMSKAEWSKRANGKTATLKAAKNGAFTLFYKGSTTRGFSYNLLNILQRNGLAKETPVQS